jgi:phosphoinositide-3-kinase regulatory subunit 4
MDISTRFQHPLEHAVITAVCPSTHWLVLGTELGILSLWDLRFGLLLKSWRAGGAVTSCQIHPSRGRDLWLVVSVERKSDEAPITEVYDIETSKLVEVYELRTTRPSSKSPPVPVNGGNEDIPDKATLIAQLAARQTETVLDSSDNDKLLTPSVLSVVVGQKLSSLSSKDEEAGMLMSVPEAKSMINTNPGFMITAGEDRVVRYWDLAKPGEGLVICGSPKEKDVVFKCVLFLFGLQGHADVEVPGKHPRPRRRCTTPFPHLTDSQWRRR